MQILPNARKKSVGCYATLCSLMAVGKTIITKRGTRMQSTLFAWKPQCYPLVINGLKVSYVFKLQE